MTSINITSRVFFENDSFSHFFQNVIEGVWYVPHLMKSYTVVNVDTEQAVLDTSKIRFKDYILTVAKIAFFIFISPKSILFFAPAALIQRQFHRFTVEDKTMNTKKTEEGLTPFNTNKEVENPKGKEDNKKVHKVFIDTFVTKVEVSDQKIEVIEEPKVDIEDLFEGSLAESRNKKTLIPKVYIKQAFIKISDVILQKKNVLNFTDYLTFFNENKKILVDKALEGIKNNRQFFETSFDDEFKKLNESMLTVVAKALTLTSSEDCVQALELAIVILDKYKDDPENSILKKAKSIIDDKIHKRQALFLIGLHIQSKGNVSTAQSVISLVSQIYEPEYVREIKERLMSWFLVGTWTIEQVNEWEVFFGEGSKEPLDLMRAVLELKKFHQETIEQKLDIDKLSLLIKKIKALIPEDLEPAKGSKIYASLKSEFENLALYTQAGIANILQLTAMKKDYDPIAKKLELPEMVIEMEVNNDDMIAVQLAFGNE